MNLGLNYPKILGINYELRTKVMNILCSFNGVLSYSSFSFIFCIVFKPTKFFFRYILLLLEMCNNGHIMQSWSLFKCPCQAYMTVQVNSGHLYQNTILIVYNSKGSHGEFCIHDNYINESIFNTSVNYIAVYYQGSLWHQLSKQLTKERTNRITGKEAQADLCLGTWRGDVFRTQLPWKLSHTCK